MGHTFRDTACCLSLTEPLLAVHTLTLWAGPGWVYHLPDTSQISLVMKSIVASGLVKEPKEPLDGEASPAPPANVDDNIAHNLLMLRCLRPDIGIAVPECKAAATAYLNCSDKSLLRPIITTDLDSCECPGMQTTLLDTHSACCSAAHGGLNVLQLTQV